MLRHEDHVPPVGFAREPRVRRWLWVRRITLFIFIGFLIALLSVGVFDPGSRDNPTPTQTETLLPGPI